MFIIYFRRYGSGRMGNNQLISKALWEIEEAELRCIDSIMLGIIVVFHLIAFELFKFKT